MGMLDQILSAQGGNLVGNLASQFGVSPGQAQGALEALLPAISGGFKGQAQQGGLDALSAILGGGNHSAALDDPAAMAAPGTRDLGNAVLGQIFGSKDVSRTVAAQAAQSTGLSDGLLKQMLPVIATMAAGALGGKAMGGGSGGGLADLVGGLLGGGQAQGGAQSGGLGGLASMLDMDKDGNPLDDIMGMAGKLFGR